MQAFYVIDANSKKETISPDIYGNFAEHLGKCVYEGLYVGTESSIPNVKGMRSDVVNALKQIKLPVLRWPGGCFSSDYHWMDAIGRQEDRAVQVNNCWGNVKEDNRFGTHEFMELCSQIGCKPYINGNLESGTVRELQQWIEYMTSDGDGTMPALRKKNGQEKPWKVPYFCIGNENWGYGGNMTAAAYANDYRKYQSFIRNYQDNQIYKIAVGPGCAYKEPILEWTEEVMKTAGKFMDGISIHYYAIPSDVWEPKGSAAVFTREEWYHTLMKAGYMDELIDRTCKVMDRYDTEERVGLIVDEWGAWYDAEPDTNPAFHFQQNTMRDAMIAGLTLNIFNKYAGRVVMANMAQLTNTMQAVIFTDQEKMVLTPTYYVFDLFKEHQGNTLLDSKVWCREVGTEMSKVQQVSESSSLDKNGVMYSTVCNLSCEDSANMELMILGRTASTISGEILCDEMTAHNTFDYPGRVTKKIFSDFEMAVQDENTKVKFLLPACSVLRITIE